MSRFMYDTWRLVFSVTLVATLYLTENGSAQDLDYTIDVLIDRESEDIDPEDIALLESLRREPLDINRARRTELEQLPWISPNLAQAIIAWRDRHGDFDRTGALLRVPGVTYALITRIEPFVHVTGKRVLRTRGRWRVAQSRTDRPDLTGNGILGIQADLELGGWIDLGGQAERRSRAGEYKWRSGYVELVRRRASCRIILGRYEMDFGQGLVWRSRSIRPSTASLSASVKRRNRGLRPVRTTYVSGALHGTAFEYQRRGLTLTGILSRADTGVWISGGRLAWNRGKGQLGLSANHSAGRVRAGMDLDVIVGATNVFGEMTLDDAGNQIIQGGMVWSMSRVEGGLMIHRQADARYIEKAERAWESLLLRWKPQRSTTVQLSVEPRLLYRQLYLRRTVRIRRRMARNVVLSGVWRRERDERGTGAESLLEIWQGQVSWRLPGAVQWRGRYERQYQSGRKPEHDLRLFMRYRSRDRISLSTQWEYTLAGFSGLEGTDSLFRTNRRLRWVILLYGPVRPGVSTLVRYARTRQTRYDTLKLPLVETRWTLQMNVRW